MLSCQRCHQLSIVRVGGRWWGIGDKNSNFREIMSSLPFAKCCSRIHQNLITGSDAGGYREVCGCVMQEIQGGWAGAWGGVGDGERNYTTSINLLYSLSVFQPPTHTTHTHTHHRLSSSSLYLPLHRISPLSSLTSFALYPFFFIVSSYI